MKSRFLLPLALLLSSPWPARAVGDAPALPPPELRSEWKELEGKKFSDWTIKSFLGWASPADGGSKVFAFETGSGERFSIMAANRGYWTAEERKEARQVFFLLHENRFFRIEPGSKEEESVIGKLAAAADTLQGEGRRSPELLKDLAARLKSREPMFAAVEKE